MAQSKFKKQLFNMAYGIGASIVIIGALFKILHWEFGPLNGGLLLAVGLITEALIFAISAFEPVDEDYDWSLVFPELADGQSKTNKNRDAEARMTKGILSRKLDNLFQEANLDAQLFNSLGKSIKSMEDAARNLSPITGVFEETKKYSDELSLATAQMESLNDLYKNQLVIAGRHASIYHEVEQSTGELREQMESLASNLSVLNTVYGGMLSSMAGKTV